MAPKVKAKIVKDVTQLVLARRTRMCNFLEYKGVLLLSFRSFYMGSFMILDWADSKVVYRRYASLFFVCGIGSSDNELVTLEIIHRYVEVLDRYFGNVSHPAHSISLIMDSRKHRCANLTCEYPAHGLSDQLIV
jgi:AP-1 complex subunit sigma 1/2